MDIQGQSKTELCCSSGRVSLIHSRGQTSPPCVIPSCTITPIFPTGKLCPPCQQQIKTELQFALRLKTPQKPKTRDLDDPTPTLSPNHFICMSKSSPDVLCCSKRSKLVSEKFVWAAAKKPNLLLCDFLRSWQWCPVAICHLASPLPFLRKFFNVVRQFSFQQHRHKDAHTHARAQTHTTTCRLETVNSSCDNRIRLQ